MRAVKLEPRCPKTVNGISIDPNPDWSFHSLISELNSLELKLNAHSSAQIPTRKTCLRDHSQTRKSENGRGFVMRISEADLEDSDGDSETTPPIRSVPTSHFISDVASPSGCNVSTDALHAEPTLRLMDKADPISAVLFELNHVRRLEVKEEIRYTLSALEEQIIKEKDRFSSSLDKVKKSIVSRHEMYKKIDSQYRQKVKEAIDVHLIAIEKDREEWSQIEERKIKNDEAKIMEKARLDEKAQQDKAKVEEEAKILAENKRIEEEKRAAAEAAKKDKQQSAQNEAPQASKIISAEISNEISKNGIATHTTSSSGGNVDAQPQMSASHIEGQGKLVPDGISMHASASALKLEEIRTRKHNEVSELKKTLKFASTKDFQSFERQIARQIKQISASEEAVRGKASELVKILKNSVYQPPVGFSVFAEKVVSLCVNPGTSAFALGRVVVLVTSVFPLAMDLLLAELYTSSIYVVPRHVDYSELIEKDAYKKMLHFEERDGKMESTKKYLQRLESYMKLYGAIIQTEIGGGVENIHGMKEGWAWLARLLNSLPANISTAVALEAFLRMAGFAMFRKYRCQFKKVLDVIWKHFLHHLKSHRKDSGVEPVLQRLVSYIETNRFLEEPQGSHLPGSTFSSTTCVPTPQ